MSVLHDEVSPMSGENMNSSASVENHSLGGTDRR